MTPNDDAEKPEDRLKAAFDAFCEAWFSGTPPDPETYIKGHPECAPALREEIESFLIVVQGFAEAGPGVEAQPSDEGDGAQKERILGDFRLLREIGRGGMGVVYEAKQLSLGRNVALKVLATHMAFSGEAIVKFHREARAGGRQRHPGIVTVHETGEYEGTHYIAQELVDDGGSLSEWLNDYRQEATLPVGYFREVARRITEVASALQHAHDSGVIHRDIKPSNILLTKDGRPKVTDFGLARVEGALALSRTGDFFGTPYYMSPEQASGRRGEMDHRTDIFSLGVTLYEMLALSPPFEGETTHDIIRKIIQDDPIDPRKLNSRVPRDLAVICLKAMEKNPNARYPTMAEFADDLGRYLDGEVIRAKPPGTLTRIGKRVKRQPVFSAAAGLALIAVAALLFSLPLYAVKLTREKNRIQRYEEEATDQAIRAGKHTQEILSLSDIKRLSDLHLRSEMLWPAYPDKVEDIEEWLNDARELVKRLPGHRQTLTAWTANPYEASDFFEEEWQVECLKGLIKNLEAFSDGKTGAIKEMEERLDIARTIRHESIEKHLAAWDAAIASIADRDACPRYEGLTITCQLGLVPLRRDPESSLWEFRQLHSGEAPEIDSDGKYVFTEETGLILVLIPGGCFEMGAVPPDDKHPEGSPNVDPWARKDESPIRSEDIEPFFLSKYEMSQAQWLRLAGKNPSTYHPGVSFSGEEFSLIHPVESASWEEGRRYLSRMGLRLPAEAEWEYAARAGTTTIWWTGNEKNTLINAANIKDNSNIKLNFGEYSCFHKWLDDGKPLTAPVHWYQANPYGLHNILGNVDEWCEDRYEQRPSHDFKIVRGGRYADIFINARSSGKRKYLKPDQQSPGVGLRPARSLDDG